MNPFSNQTTPPGLLGAISENSGCGILHLFGHQFPPLVNGDKKNSPLTDV